MSCIHITACQLAPSSICPSTFVGAKFAKVSFKLKSRCQSAPIVCLFGGKGKPETGNEGSPWKSLENAMGNLKKDQSIEDVLKQQIQKQEYYDDGGTPGKPPGGGGGGGGGGGFGEAEDGGFSEMWDEFTQVILATTGFIFLYIYILEGEEITVIAKDLLRFLFTRQKSIRLNRLISQWRSFLERMKQKSEFDPHWLEREIINTPTWYDHPAKYEYIVRALSSPSRRDYDQDQIQDQDQDDAFDDE